jgi:uncharacterized protein YdhG (YjbR/CyaY superfamily)
MAKVAFGNVDDYIDSQPDGSRGLLDQVRKAIRKAMPRAEEAISYNIPAYKLDGGVVIYFAGWKKHYSLYPVNEELVAAFREELATYEIDKGTIRFPLSEPVPVKLIERIAKFRARQTAAKKRRSASI